MSSERNAASPLDLWLDHLPSSRHQQAREWWALSQETGRLLNHWPTLQRQLVSSWVGNRWYFNATPGPWPAGPTVAIGSSRWGRRPEQWIPLANQLHATLTDLQPFDYVLITAADTTCDRLVRRWANTRHCRWIDLHLPSSRWDWFRWCDFLFRTYGRLGPHRLSNVVHVSPPWPLDASTQSEFPVRDLLLAAGSDQWRVIFQRPRGVIAQLTQARIDQQGIHPGLTTSPENASRPDIRHPDILHPDSHCHDSGRRRPRGSSAASSAFALPEGEFLLHWTRACAGCWPGQTDDEFLDELLSGEISPRLAVDVLQRIVTTERLLGTGVAIRGGHSMVCFTAQSFHELIRHRTYRSHRQRWDAEPYGLAIARSWLVDRGARPVCYGDDSTWSGLAPSDRPYFQLARSRSAGSQPIDWTIEREWRIASPLDLSTLRSDEAWIWVPDELSAASIRRVSRWPVIVANSDDSPTIDFREAPTAARADAAEECPRPALPALDRSVNKKTLSSRDGGEGCEPG
ncbi:MAG: hypothetical protein U0795_15100 [Pirellulales bacterium]